MAEESRGGLANDYLICRSNETDDYSIWSFDIRPDQPLLSLKKTGKFDRTHQMIPIGDYILEWGPIAYKNYATDQGVSGIYPYRLFKFDANIEDPLAIEAKSERSSPTLVTRGIWTKSKFFWLVPDFGSPQGPGKEFMKGDTLLLVPLGTFILLFIPTAGRGTFKLFQFDPASPDPVALFPTTDPHSVPLGSFGTIQIGHELIPLGNYVLDWLPKTREYWLWSFDSMNETPLARPAIQADRWHDIDENHQLIPIGEYVIDWDMKRHSYRLWLFDATSDNPLTGPEGKPVRSGEMPQEFDAQTIQDNAAESVVRVIKGNILTGIPGLRPIDEASKDVPGTIDFMRSKIKHVVYYMVENRSFDHACGWLYENDANIIKFVGHNRPFQGASLDMYNCDPTGKKVHLNIDGPDVTTREGVDLYHDMTDTLRQCFQNPNGYAEQRPDMGGFVRNNGNELPMSTSKPEKLPVLTGLAKAFAVSDEWFCSMPGATDANRAFALTGSALGELNNFMSGPKYDDWPILAHRASIWKVLWANGFTDWKIYNSIQWANYILTYHLYLEGQIPTVDNAVKPYLAKSATTSKYLGTFDQFKDDAKNGTLPAFSFLEPVWIELGGSAPGSAVPSATSYHPLGKGGVGPAEKRLNEIYEALKTGPKWNETLLIITFDEHGGFFDHVPPPRAVNPWPNDINDGFSYDLMGVRVPTILVSPWIEKNTVFRAPTPLDYNSPAPVAYDSTSILATLLHWYGIRKASWGLGRRVHQAPTFEPVFRCKSPRSDKPPFEAPRLEEESGRPETLTDHHFRHLSGMIQAITGDRCSAKERRKITRDILTHAQDVPTLTAMLDQLADRY